MHFRVGLLCLLLSVEVSAADGTTVSEKDYQLPTCQTPVASVAIGTFTCKSQGCQEAAEGQANQMAALMRMAQAAQEGISEQSFPGIGEGMTSMLTTTLQQTGCFRVQDRESIEQLKQEMELAGVDFKPEPADFLISGAITSISMQTQRRTGAIAFIGGSRRQVDAELGMDVRITDVKNGRLLAATTVVGNNQTTSTTFAGGGVAGGAVLVGGASSVKDTPMEGIVRDVLARTATYASNQIVAAQQALQVSASTNTSAVMSSGSTVPAVVEGTQSGLATPEESQAPSEDIDPAGQ